MLNHGGYDVIRRELTRKRTEREQDAFVNGFLARFDEQENGKYLYDVDEWSIKTLYEACKMADGDAQYSNINESGELASGSFSVAISGLISKQILRSYDEIALSADFIADRLVEVKKTSMKSEKVLRFSSLPLLRYQRELEAPQPFNVNEAYFGYRTHKWGREISISEETVMFDQTGMIWEQAKRLGQAGALLREQLILDGFQDLQSSSVGSDDGMPSSEQYVYYPSDSGADLYSASAPDGISSSSNIVASNALEDYSDLKACRDRMNQFLDDTDEKRHDSDANKGKRIRVTGRPLIVIPTALEDKAYIIANTMKKVGSGNNDANPSNGGPFAFDVVSSVLLDDNSDTTWYYGYPKRQFRLYETRPFRLMSINRAACVDSMRRGVYGIVIADWYAGVAAMDNKFVLKCTA